MLCFERYQGIPYFHTDRVDKRMVNTLPLVMINIAYDTDSLEDKSVLFPHFYLSEKKQKPGLYLRQGGNKLLNMFFRRCNYRICRFSELAYSTPVSLVLIF